MEPNEAAAFVRAPILIRQPRLHEFSMNPVFPRTPHLDFSSDPNWAVLCGEPASAQRGKNSRAGKLSFRKTVALHVQRSDLQYPISAIWDTVFLHKVQTQCLVLKRCDFPS